MKKLLSIILTACLFLSFTACDISEHFEITDPENVTAITLSESEAILFENLQDEKIIYFDYAAERYVSEIDEAFTFVSENPDIATFAHDENSWVSRCIITSVSYGEAYIYVQTQDGSVKSEKLKVIVSEPKPEIEASEPETTVQNKSRTVYTTPTGKKYHYSQSCAGKNAIPTTEETAKASYGACKKCVK